jgi:glycerol uptake facilitator-like aquaporin
VSRAAEPTGPPLGRRCLAEGLRTAALVAVVIGSGIAAERLSLGQVGPQLLEISLVTGAGLVALILALQPISAAFNPVVALAECALGALTTTAPGLSPPSYITAAYWYISSTSANPTVTIARTLWNTFTGIAPTSVPMFLGMQILGGALAQALVRLLYPDARAVVAHLTAEPGTRSRPEE